MIISFILANHDSEMCSPTEIIGYTGCLFSALANKLMMAAEFSRTHHSFPAHQTCTCTWVYHWLGESPSFGARQWHARPG